MSATYLVFGDLHGKVLPAFRLAMAWQREHGVPLAGLLQVGDLGFFPDVSRLDKATLRHAREDPLELGARLIAEESQEADEIFHGREAAPEALWFAAGNHEDFRALTSLRQAAGYRADSFAVDAYLRVRCVVDGRVAMLPGPLRVGALWGIDNAALKARRRVPSEAYIRSASAASLAGSQMDVLLTHDGPRDAVLHGAGSEAITEVIRAARPRFAFFGHYGGRARRIEGNFGSTAVYLMHGLQLKHHGGCAEEGSVGVLQWDGEGGVFEYLDPRWLRSFTRQHWRHR